MSSETRQQIVRYADLDLTRPAGAAALFARISGAARDVCEPLNPQRWVSRQCVDLALARAVADVNAPALTDYYMARTGQHVGAGASAMLYHERGAAAVGGSAK